MSKKKVPERVCVEFDFGRADVISKVPTDIIGTMEYIRADLAKPKVKKLSWNEYHAKGYRRGLVVGYSDTGRETEIHRTPHGWLYDGFMYQAHVGKSGSIDEALNEAIKAAQDAYEARILSLLE